MRIRKYDFNYGRRMLMEKAGKGIATAGVLSPLWPLIAKGADTSKAYPDELISIEMITKGKLKPGDTLTADNIDIVKDMVAPITYHQVKTMGRRIGLVESVKDTSMLFNHTYLDRTLQNKGRAKLGPDKNVWTDGVVGNQWLGGLPFPEPKNGNECIADLSMSWGRHNYAQYPIVIDSLGPSGDVDFHHELLWCELQVTSRNDGKVFHNMNDLLRIQSLFFTEPQNAAGTSFLSPWYYDQRKFPKLYGYLPAFRRIRQYPTNQRFEPLLPGMTFYLSQAWGAGDPMLTWGNYKIVGRKPALAAVGPKNWYGGETDNWLRPVHGGAKGKTFLETWYELVPEMVVFDGSPTGYPRAPVGKRRVWLDGRNLMCDNIWSYDRDGKLFKSFEPGFCQYKNDRAEVKCKDGTPNWSWAYVHSFNIQDGRMSRLQHAEHIHGGYKDLTFADEDKIYNKFMTTAAIQRLGQV